MRSVRYQAWYIIAVLLLLLPAAAAAQTTTIIIVRHAERLDSSQDPPLNEAGQQRAAALADALASTTIDAIYTTQYARTRLTAEPVAKRFGLTPKVMSAGGGTDAHAAEIAARIRADDSGRTVLVVGHSNTVPAIVRALSGVDVGAIGDAAYDHMYIVLLDGAGAARVIRAGYPPR